MLDKAKWQRIWGFEPGSPEGEAAWDTKGAPRRLNAPAVLSDNIPPTRGPDGRMHDTLSGYRRSLRPDGNPQGERYIELGNERVKPVEHTFDRAQRREDIKAGMMDVKYGRVPPLTVLED